MKFSFKSRALSNNPRKLTWYFHGVSEMLSLQTSEEVQRDKSMPADGDGHPAGYVLRRQSELKVTLYVSHKPPCFTDQEADIWRGQIICAGTQTFYFSCRKRHTPTYTHAHTHLHVYTDLLCHWANIGIHCLCLQGTVLFFHFSAPCTLKLPLTHCSPFLPPEG